MFALFQTFVPAIYIFIAYYLKNKMNSYPEFVLKYLLHFEQ